MAAAQRSPLSAEIGTLDHPQVADLHRAGHTDRADTTDIAPRAPLWHSKSSVVTSNPCILLFTRSIVSPLPTTPALGSIAASRL
jgi:hypothetical protein